MTNQENNINDLDKIIKVMKITEKLKYTPRAINTTDGNPESTAAHSWWLSFLFIMLNNKLKLDIDVQHCLELITVHDIAEAITWDYAAYEVDANQNLVADKESKEEAAMQQIKKELPDDLWKYIYDLWKEYETWETKEAKLIKSLDKQECLLQILNAKHIDAPRKHEWESVRNFMLTYGDKQMQKTPILNNFWQKIKNSLKKWVKKIKEDWNNNFRI